MSLSVLSARFVPTFSSVSPSSGDPGDRVDLEGLQFADSADVPIRVFFGETEIEEAEIDLVAETVIRVTVPEGDPETAVSVRIVFPSGVEKTLANAFTYNPA